ncbi:hypothetical protein BCR33DRAFT_424333 [Rhizoclosmatium globosum]|uniref:Uncharacterized protein n=1 Tax=Rhizoclosmatium globosum TaxID=329046 RepID=A0A1Y1ZGH4_9FUNG|nr:hypothetical protein BCR33DRAFT_424333 [Rhizoclosmatium globosum]|eukprot:ORY09264.1 hypothetical protein BCR33DRAFT_424333 [Rhizoclosmatium globosum]
MASTSSGTTKQFTVSANITLNHNIVDPTVFLERNRSLSEDILPKVRTLHFEMIQKTTVETRTQSTNCLRKHIHGRRRAVNLRGLESNGRGRTSRTTLTGNLLNQRRQHLKHVAKLTNKIRLSDSSSRRKRPTARRVHRRRQWHQSGSGSNTSSSNRTRHFCWARSNTLTFVHILPNSSCQLQHRRLTRNRNWLRSTTTIRFHLQLQPNSKLRSQHVSASKLNLLKHGVQHSGTAQGILHVDHQLLIRERPHQLFILLHHQLRQRSPLVRTGTNSSVAANILSRSLVLAKMSPVLKAASMNTSSSSIVGFNGSVARWSLTYFFTTALTSGAVWKLFSTMLSTMIASEGGVAPFSLTMATWRRIVLVQLRTPLPLKGSKATDMVRSSR